MELQILIKTSIKKLMLVINNMQDNYDNYSKSSLKSNSLDGPVQSLAVLRFQLITYV